MHESLHDTLTRYSWWNGGNVSNWKTAIAVPLPAQRAALSLLSYNKGAIFMGVRYCWLIGGGIRRRPHNWNAMERSEMERCHCEAGREVTDRCLIMEINFPLISIDTKARFLNKWKKWKILKGELPTSSYLYGRVSCKLILGWMSSQTWGSKSHKTWEVKAQES